MAVESPLLETTISGATDVIINVSGDISMYDADDAASYVQQLTGDDVNIIFGAMYDASVPETCQITVIATGIEDKPQAQAQNKFGANFSVKPQMNAQRQPGVSVRPVGTMQHTAAQPSARTAAPQGNAASGQPSGQKPVTLRSNVEAKSLKVPDFLLKK